MTVEDLINLIAALPADTEIVIRSMEVMPVVAVQLVEDLGPGENRTRVHLLMRSDYPTPMIDLNARLADAMDRIAPKKEPWDEQ